MPRTKRLVNGEEKTAYHIMSRTALDGFPFGNVEKDELVKIIKKFSNLFFVEVFGFCIMGNHFHSMSKAKKNESEDIADMFMKRELLISLKRGRSR